MVRAKLLWKDGTTDADYQKSFQMKVGQQRKSDNTTHLPWRTIPMKLHLKRGDDGKGTGLLFFKEGGQGPMRQRPDFREAKHAYRRGVRLYGSSSNWMEKLSLSSSSSSQWQQNNEWKSDSTATFKVEIISIGKPAASQQEMFPTNSFYLVQVVVFRLPATFCS